MVMSYLWVLFLLPAVMMTMTGCRYAAGYPCVFVLFPGQAIMQSLAPTLLPAAPFIDCANPLGTSVADRAEQILVWCGNGLCVPVAVSITRAGGQSLRWQMGLGLRR